MRLLRRADVKILCQLMTVHEGIEDMRWMMENHGVSTSRGSSLASSLSSLVTVEEFGPCISPCRESPSPSPVCLQDLTETTGEESEEQQQQPHTDDGDSNNKSYFNVLSPKDSEARAPRPSTAKFGVVLSSHAQASTNPACGLEKSQTQDLASPLQSIKTNANTIRRALLRSSRLRKEVTEDTSSVIFTKPSGETRREHQAQESFRASQSKTVEDNSTLSAQEDLLDYDAKWCWVASQDDVTFL
ncbi:uncharacterized protein LOC113171389 [Anabas testudineus]|uniref:uncharacterized protein LOC113171389 n=1 Tax=Anabas testudineus TaxID=64144 RepID=UPI000E45D37E|nr:uncharacterized protein LOC113171389 [Anabas testudineus]